MAEHRKLKGGAGMGRETWVTPMCKNQHPSFCEGPGMWRQSPGKTPSTEQKWLCRATREAKKRGQDAIHRIAYFVVAKEG